jgi:hypothetical protein
LTLFRKWNPEKGPNTRTRLTQSTVDQQTVVPISRNIQVPVRKLRSATLCPGGKVHKTLGKIGGFHQIGQAAVTKEAIVEMMYKDIK